MNGRACPWRGVQIRQLNNAPDLKHDDNEPDLDVFGASQLHSGPMPQMQPQEALGYTNKKIDMKKIIVVL
jgi:hypothetical protein